MGTHFLGFCDRKKNVISRLWKTVWLVDLNAPEPKPMALRNSRCVARTHRLGKSPVISI